MKNQFLAVALSQCLVFLSAICFVSTVAIAEETSPVPPTARTITDSEGRKIEVLILGKSDTSIKAKRKSDQMEFTFELARLSTDDQVFISQLAHAPVKTHTALLTMKDDVIKSLLEKKGFAVTSPPLDSYKDKVDGVVQNPAITFLRKISDEELKKFDIIWVNRWVTPWLPGGLDHEQADRMLDLIATNKKVVWEVMWEKPKELLLAKKESKHNGRAKSKIYIRRDENVILYSDKISDWNEKEDRREIIEKHPEILEQAAVEAKKLVSPSP